MTQAVKTWLLQLVIGTIVIIAVTLWHTSLFFSAILGVATMMVACFYWVFSMWRVERKWGETHPKVVRLFYLGQMVKYLVLVVAVVLYLQYLQLNWLVFLMGVLAVQLGSMMMVIRVKQWAKQ